MNNSSRRRFDVFCSGARLRYRITVLSHFFQVHLNSAAHEFCGFLESEAACDTARQVRRVGAVSRSRFFVDNQVLHGFNPACSRMLLRVFGAASSEGWPAIVTRSEEHTSELQSLRHLVCRLLLEKKQKYTTHACGGQSGHAPSDCTRIAPRP